MNRRTLIASIAFLLALVSISGNSPALAQSTAIVRVSPSTQSGPSNTTASVDIIITNATNLYGNEIHLNFDPSLLAVRDASLSQSGTQIEVGPWLTSGGAGTYAVAVNNANNGAGTIDFAISLLNPMTPMSGSGTIARINFQTLAAGSSPVHINSTILADRNGGRLSATTQDGVIIVQQGSDQQEQPPEVPEADTLVLLGSGLGGLATWLGWQRRRVRALTK